MAATKNKYLTLAEYVEKGGALDNLIRFVDPPEYAEMRGVTPDQVRTAARSGSLVAIKTWGKVLLDPELAGNMEWEPAAGGRRPARADGRIRYQFYGTEDEYEAVKAFGVSLDMPDDAFVDPRARRKARKAAKVAETATEASPDDDAFEDFGLS